MMAGLAAILPPDVGAGLFAMMLGASFIASFITISFGIGGGAVLLAVLATLLPPAVLLPIHGPVQVGSNLGRAGTLFRHVSWKDMPGFTIGSIVGVSLGGALIVNI